MNTAEHRLVATTRVVAKVTGGSLAEILDTKPTRIPTGYLFETKYLGNWELSRTDLSIADFPTIRGATHEKIMDVLEKWHKSPGNSKVKSALEDAMSILEFVIADE